MTQSKGKSAQSKGDYCQKGNILTNISLQSKKDPMMKEGEKK
jgi:hypothetical protein